MDNLDETDKDILQILQRGDVTNEEIGERIEVSSTTVGDRIDDLEERGIIRDYTVVIDYEKAGLPHHFLLFCTVPISDQAEIAAQALQVHGVVNVQEILADEENLHIEIVGESSDKITETIEMLENGGIEIEGSVALKRNYCRPFNGFGSDTLE